MHVVKTRKNIVHRKKSGGQLTQTLSFSPGPKSIGGLNLQHMIIYCVWMFKFGNKNAPEYVVVVFFTDCVR